jgi:hypothetical protein
MSSQSKCTSPQPPTPPSSTSPSIFTPEFLALLDGRNEPLTVTEADLAGPWKLESGGPEEVAVLREWESLDAGDVPRAVFCHEETAALFALALPLHAREPLFHLDQELGRKGHTVTAVFGEQGPQPVGWLEQYEPGLLVGLHLLEGLVRSPRALAQLLRIAGGLALRQVGRILADER